MHYKQNNKESKTYVQGLRSFGSTLPRTVRSILKKNGYNYTEIISKWSSLVGDEVSKNSYPKSIKMTKGDKNGTLILGVKRGNEINIEYSKKEIINKINSYFGYQLINEVRLQTFNADEKKLKKKNSIKNLNTNLRKKIDKIKNTGVRNSLSQFLEVVDND